MSSAVPRPEYPRPQFERADWLCLNGEWQFEMDSGDSGLERGLCTRELSGRITVPFCPESILSGIGHVDFMNAVWYRSEVRIPADWAGRRVLLHFGAVDFDSTVWVNGREVARHRGGWTPFTCDLHGVAEPGTTATIVVRARDDHKRPRAMGKQSHKYASEGCLYTRTTGIWQTVWMEPVSHAHLGRARITPDFGNTRFLVQQSITGRAGSLRVRATLSDAAGIVSTETCGASADFAPTLVLGIPGGRVRPWSPADPHLYDLKMELLAADGTAIDTVKSYCGLRSVALDGMAFRLNGEVLFQRLVLDQGYYPDGLMTAPTDEALVRDIRLSMEAGFNGARLHQKVFEERFLYHADRMGYLVWGEFGDWGCASQGFHYDHQKPGPDYVSQWTEALLRDYSHPSIIGWCPLNETYQTLGDRTTVLDDVTRAMFLATKAADATRPVLDASGYSHRIQESDVYDSHSYEQDPARFAEEQAGLAEGRPFLNATGGLYPYDERRREISIPWRGQPFFISEFGGIWWNPDAKEGEDSWGYGERPRTLEEFHARFAGLCGVLLDNPLMFAYCYTQLTDVFQEQNGIYRFDRTPKFDMERIRAVQARPAAIELAARASEERDM